MIDLAPFRIVSIGVRAGAVVSGVAGQDRRSPQALEIVFPGAASGRPALRSSQMSDKLGPRQLAGAMLRMPSAPDKSVACLERHGLLLATTRTTDSGCGLLAGSAGFSCGAAAVGEGGSSNTDLTSE